MRANLTVETPLTYDFDALSIVTQYLSPGGSTCGAVLPSDADVGYAWAYPVYRVWLRTILMHSMTHMATTTVALVFLLVGTTSTLAEDGKTLAELDAFWAEVSRTVAEGDYDDYAATYHLDAILVTTASHRSYPIATALAGWKQGFLDTRAGSTEARVEFRFTQRLNDETTAHETGIFHYTAVSETGEETDQYLHFEALLVKTNAWRMMMEYQKVPATQEEWAAAD